MSEQNFDGSKQVDNEEILIPRNSIEVPQTEIAMEIEGYTNYYNPTQEAITKGLKTKGYIVPPEENYRLNIVLMSIILGKPSEEIKTAEQQKAALTAFARERRSGLRKDKLDEYVDFYMKFLKSSDMGGMHYTTMAGTDIVIVNRDSSLPRKRVVRHELLHAMSSDASEVNGGGFQSADGVGNSLNEACLELLEIQQRTNGTGFNPLSDIQWIEEGGGENESPYALKLFALGFLIGLTERSGQAIQASDIASVFFDPSKKAIEKRQILKNEFLSRISIQQQRAKKLLDDYCYKP